VRFGDDRLDAGGLAAAKLDFDLSRQVAVVQ
jgi:hypothetical protein